MGDDTTTMNGFIKLTAHVSQGTDMANVLVANGFSFTLYSTNCTSTAVSSSSINITDRFKMYTMSYLHTHICTDNYLTLPIMVYLDTPTSIVAEQGLMSHQTHYRLYW